jgi:hypothetical protein
MTQRELKTAERLLVDLTDHTQSVVLDGGGYAVTAYWRTGGQRLFTVLDFLRVYLRSHAINTPTIETQQPAPPSKRDRRADDCEAFGDSAR